MVQSVLLKILILLQCASANTFLYTYVTGELTVTVSEVSHISTVIDGLTYDFSFLEPTSTNTVKSAYTDQPPESSVTDSEDNNNNGLNIDSKSIAAISSSLAAVSITDDSVNVQTDTATTFTTLTNSNSTSIVATTTVAANSTRISADLGLENGASTNNSSTNSSSSTSSKAGAGALSASYMLGGLMLFACLL